VQRGSREQVGKGGGSEQSWKGICRLSSPGGFGTSRNGIASGSWGACKEKEKLGGDGSTMWKRGCVLKGPGISLSGKLKGSDVRRNQQQLKIFIAQRKRENVWGHSSENQRA